MIEFALNLIARTASEGRRVIVFSHNLETLDLMNELAPYIDATGQLESVSRVNGAQRISLTGGGHVQFVPINGHNLRAQRADLLFMPHDSSPQELRAAVSAIWAKEQGAIHLY